MSVDTVFSAIQVVATVVVAFVGFRINSRWRNSDAQRQSSQRQAEARGATSAVLHDLTTGEVEHARNLVGTLRYGSVEKEWPTEQEVVRACYRLIWAIERAATAGLAVERLDHEVVMDARTNQLQWHLVEIVRNIELLSAALAIDDEEAAARRKDVVSQLNAWSSPGRDELSFTVDNQEFARDLESLKATLKSLDIPIRTNEV